MSKRNPRGPGSRGPYRRDGARTTYGERLATRMQPQPPCKCGCGSPAPWDTSRARWQKYAEGHYRKPAAYKGAAWLREQYVGMGRTQAEIAAECGVGPSTIAKFMRKFKILPRGRSESRIGRMVGAKNPAWKGGVAAWDYASGWKVIARKIRDLDKWTCQLCGEQRKRWGKLLHVHHIDGDKLNNSPSNLVSVCATCHPRGDRERELAPTLRAITAQREGVI